MYLTIALALTLLVLLFARDVSRSAHGAIGPRRSENRSFGALANSLVSQENIFDGHLSYLLVHGATLSRPIFAARMSQLREQLPHWAIEADQLRRPQLAHNVNGVVGAQTEVRIDVVVGRGEFLDAALAGVARVRGRNDRSAADTHFDESAVGARSVFAR
jgi:hypothetical protein